MNDELKLKILKSNLQLLTDANDDFLKKLINQAKSLMKREGIKEENTDDYEMAVIDYAAFLFRKRANSEMMMPRHLRYELNNIIFSQKASDE